MLIFLVQMNITFSGFVPYDCTRHIQVQRDNYIEKTCIIESYEEESTTNK